MNQESSTSPNYGSLAWTFLAGAAVGAVVVALTTPKSGPQLRGDLKDMGNTIRRKASDLVNADEDRLHSRV